MEGSTAAIATSLNLLDLIIAKHAMTVLWDATIIVFGWTTALGSITIGTLCSYSFTYQSEVPTLLSWLTSAGTHPSGISSLAAQMLSSSFTLPRSSSLEATLSSTCGQSKETWWRWSYWSRRKSWDTNGLSIYHSQPKSTSSLELQSYGKQYCWLRETIFLWMDLSLSMKLCRNPTVWRASKRSIGTHGRTETIYLIT